MEMNEVTQEQRIAVVSSLFAEACFETHPGCKAFVHSFQGNYHWEQTVLAILEMRKTSVYDLVRLYDAANEVMASTSKKVFLKGLAGKIVKKLDSVHTNRSHLGITFLQMISRSYYGDDETGLSAAAEKKLYECLRAREQASTN